MAAVFICAARIAAPPWPGLVSTPAHCVRRPSAQKPFDVVLAHLARVAPVVTADETVNPVGVCLPGPQAEVLQVQTLARLVEQCW